MPYHAHLCLAKHLLTMIFFTLEFIFGHSSIHDNHHRLALQPIGKMGLVDVKNRTLLLSSPKGGATVAAQLFSRYEGVYQEALQYDPWIHNYVSDIFNEHPNHPYVNCREVCTDPNWTCIKIVRQPLDRVVSSYIHTMNRGLWKNWAELKESAPTRYPGTYVHNPTASNITFQDFILALQRVARVPQEQQTKSPGSQHFMPQKSRCDFPSVRKTGALTPGVHLVPVEGLSDNLRAVGNLTGIYFDDSNLSSHHYIKKDQSLLPTDAPSWPLEKVIQEHPSYDAFVRPRSHEATSLCFLFLGDFDLYRRACRQPWIRRCEACSKECDLQVARIRAVCGPPQQVAYRDRESSWNWKKNVSI